MKDLAAIVALYGLLDDLLEGMRAEYVSASDSANAARVVERQRLNDQAYFVLCWGQLESAIDDRCRKAIRARQDRPDWRDRRGWDRYNLDDKRLSGLSFEDRVALVTDSRAGRGSPWARITYHYGIRNQIAHGRLRPERLDVAALVQEFYELESQLAD